MWVLTKCEANIELNNCGLEHRAVGSVPTRTTFAQFHDPRDGRNLANLNKAFRLDNPAELSSCSSHLVSCALILFNH